MKVKDLVGGEIWETEDVLWATPGIQWNVEKQAHTLVNDSNGVDTTLMREIGSRTGSSARIPFAYDNEQDVYWPVEILP